MGHGDADEHIGVTARLFGEPWAFGSQQEHGGPVGLPCPQRLLGRGSRRRVCMPAVLAAAIRRPHPRLWPREG